MANDNKLNPDVQEPIDGSGQPDATVLAAGEPAPADDTAGEPAADDTAGEPAANDTAAEPPAKHRFADQLAKAYPDKKFNTPEEHDTALEELISELTGYKERGQAANQKLIAMFEAEPQIGEIVRDCVNGATFREALARHISPEDITAVEGDPDYDKWSENKKAREEGVANKKKFADDYAKNISTSEQAVTDYVEEQGLSPEDADAFFGKFDEMLDNISKGIITKENLDAWMKALNYDKDIIAATEQGKVAGLNQNIVATKAKATNGGDGLPRPNKSAQEAETVKTDPTYMDSLVAKTKKRDQFA